MTVIIAHSVASSIESTRDIPQAFPDSPVAADRQAEIIARIERLPVTRPVFWARNIIGAATFFDGYTVLCIAYAMPVLIKEWQLTPGEVGLILSAGYFGQVIGAVFFGWLAERLGRLNVLLMTIILFVSMDISCLFAWGSASMMAFRFLQGIGTGGEVPVASAYITELIGSHKRGRFFLLYESLFLFGLLGAGLIGWQLVPLYGWRAMFMVGLVPSILMLPLRIFMSESPRWLASKGRLDEADKIVTRFERSAINAGKPLPLPKLAAVTTPSKGDWRELFQGIYLKRSLTIWALWFTTYMVGNGLVTWLPTLYRQTFKLPLDTSLEYGFLASAAGLFASIVCAFLIDAVGRKAWYLGAMTLSVIPLAALTFLGATSALEVLLLAGIAYAINQTITFSLYLYSAELYPTRLRAIGAGVGSAWLRLGSSAGPLLVGWTMEGYGIRYVFAGFTGVLVIAAIVTAIFAIETRGQGLDELSP